MQLFRAWVERGDPATSRPGESIVIPERLEQIRVAEVDLDELRRSYLRNALDTVPAGVRLDEEDKAFLAAETRWSQARVKEVTDEMRRTTG